MVSLIEELEAREAAARVRVEVLEAQIAELTARLKAEREACSRLRVTRETVAEVVAELSLWMGRRLPGRWSPRRLGAGRCGWWGRSWCRTGGEGLSVDALPDVYRDIVELVTDASGPMQAKQIVPRIGLPAVTAKIEGTRGKLKRLVERGWLTEYQPGQFALAHRSAEERGKGAER